MTDESKYYVFYDGDCGFCNFWVNWILKNDSENQFLFSSLQSGFGQKFLKERGLKTNQFNTLYLWKPNSFYLIKSKAVFKITQILGGWKSAISVFRIFPSFLTDKIYDEVAKRRHSFAKNSCEIPTEEQRKKFIE